MKIDGVFSPVDIAVSGLRAHGKSMEAIISNVANSRTTDNGEGDPYRRIEATLRSSGKGISGVEIGEMTEDDSDFPTMLGANGKETSMPNVNLPIEMINLNMASKAYQANAAVLKRYQGMVNTSLELLK